MRTSQHSGEVLDLLYPSAQKRDEAKARRLRLDALPQDYVENLELSQIAAIICPTNQYNTVKLLSELNTDADIINYRLDTIDDFLAMPRLMPEIYKIISDMLDNDRHNMRKFANPTSFDTFRTQLDSFKNYVSCVNSMHGFYTLNSEKIKSAAIRRLFNYFEEIHSSDEYQRLCELVDELIQKLKSRIRSVTVAINFDEEMTPISAGIVGCSDTEYIEKPTVFEKLLYFNAKKNLNQVEGGLFRKYMSENSNDKDKVINEVDAKLFRGLSKITDDYIEKLTELFKTYQKIQFDDLFGLQEQLDFYEGVLKLISTAQFKGVPMCRPQLLPIEKRAAEMKNVYDLCLFKSAMLSKKTAVGDDLIVRNDLSMDDDARFYILTGANNGGKTTFIRAIGITQVLAQCGIYVPCESCAISPVDFIYTHFPKEEETGINTSRFTTEIKQFKVISDTITENSMLLMNESIQSTTPRECVEIASELVKIFTIIGARGIFATHLSDLAFKCDEFSGEPDCRSKVESITVCVDESTEKRIYKVKKGLPSDHSYAHTVFKQFGIDIDEIRSRK